MKGNPILLYNSKKISAAELCLLVRAFTNPPASGKVGIKIDLSDQANSI